MPAELIRAPAPCFRGTLVEAPSSCKACPRLIPHSTPSLTPAQSTTGWLQQASGPEFCRVQCQNSSVVLVQCALYLLPYNPLLRSELTPWQTARGVGVHLGGEEMEGVARGEGGWAAKGWGQGRGIATISLEVPFSSADPFVHRHMGESTTAWGLCDMSRDLVPEPPCHVWPTIWVEYMYTGAPRQCEQQSRVCVSRCHTVLNGHWSWT